MICDQFEDPYCYLFTWIFLSVSINVCGMNGYAEPFEDLLKALPSTSNNTNLALLAGSPLAGQWSVPRPWVRQSQPNMTKTRVYMCPGPSRRRMISHFAVSLLILTNEAKFMVGSILPKLSMKIMASNYRVTPKPPWWLYSLDSFPFCIFHIQVLSVYISPVTWLSQLTRWATCHLKTCLPGDQCWTLYVFHPGKETLSLPTFPSLSQVVSHFPQRQIINIFIGFLKTFWKHKQMMPFPAKHVLFICIVLGTVVDTEKNDPFRVVQSRGGAGTSTSRTNIRLASILLVLTPPKRHSGDGESASSLPGTLAGFLNDSQVGESHLKAGTLACALLL